MKSKIKIGYILSYRSNRYVRTLSLLSSLNKIDYLIVHTAINSYKGFTRYIDTLIQLIKLRIQHNPDIYILGFRGHEIFFPVRLITFGKKLIFDSMMSPSDSLKNELKWGGFGALLYFLTYIIEYLILHLSDHIITDTQSHLSMLASTFKLNHSKISYVYVGTDEELWARKTTPVKNRSRFEVFTYSSFQPLHGMEVIVNAAYLVKSFPIHFTVIGGQGMRLKRFEEQINKLMLKNISHLNWVDYEMLPHYASRADLCLGGPFGGTNQAKRVITGKTYQFLCLGKPTVIGEVNEHARFIDKQNVVIVKQADPTDLSEAIKWCYHHQDRLKKIGVNGKKLFDQEFNNEAISNALDSVIRNLGLI